MGVRLGRAGTPEWIVAETLRVDTENYQRILDEAHLARIMEDFEPDGLGILEVSRRRDGDIYLINGQHRVESIKRLGYGYMEVQCFVYEGLSIDQERALFLLFNLGHLPLNAYHAFKVRTEDPDLNTEIVMTHLQALGINFVPPGANLGVRQISALHYLEELVKTDRLVPVLTTLAAGWGEHRGAFKRLHLEIVERLLRNISPEQLVPILQQITPMALDREALIRQSSPGVQLGSYLAVFRDMLGEQTVPQTLSGSAR